MLNKTASQTQPVSLNSCQFEQPVSLDLKTTPAVQLPQKIVNHIPLENPLASSYVPKRNTKVKGLIISKPDDSPLNKLMNMLANLLKRFEKKFFDKMEQKLPPTITLKTPVMKKKDKRTIWDLDESTDNLKEG